MSNLATLRPKTGDVVDGVYHVECELGSDGTTIVLGTNVPATGKRYALRCWLGTDGAAAATSVQHFVRIANRSKLFDNSGVVEVYGVAQAQGFYYAVTEWLEGTTLERFLERNGAMSVRDVLAMINPCLEGLAAAHAAGISHGDLRPANIFLCRATRFEPERARLHKFEFGRWSDKPPMLRKRVSQDISVRQFVAPEELQGELADERTDVYAMGVLLYVMLSGLSPFASSNVRDLAVEISAGSWTPLSRRVHGLKPTLEQAIERAMATNPADRFQSMTELLAQLRKVDGRPAEGHSPGTAIEKHDPSKRGYNWIRPASEDLSPSLFDLQPVDAEVMAEERRSALASGVLRACALVACALLVGAMGLRMNEPPARTLRATAKKRAVPALQQVREAGGLSAANALPAPDHRPASGFEDKAPEQQPQPAQASSKRTVAASEPVPSKSGPSIAAATARTPASVSSALSPARTANAVNPVPVAAPPVDTAAPAIAEARETTAAARTAPAPFVPSAQTSGSRPLSGARVEALDNMKLE